VYKVDDSVINMLQQSQLNSSFSDNSYHDVYEELDAQSNHLDAVSLASMDLEYLSRLESDKRVKPQENNRKNVRKVSNNANMQISSLFYDDLEEKHSLPSLKFSSTSPVYDNNINEYESASNTNNVMFDLEYFSRKTTQKSNVQKFNGNSNRNESMSPITEIQSQSIVRNDDDCTIISMMSQMNSSSPVGVDNSPWSVNIMSGGESSVDELMEPSFDGYEDTVEDGFIEFDLNHWN